MALSALDDLSVTPTDEQVAEVVGIDQWEFLRSAPNGAVEAVWLQRSCQWVSCVRLGR